MLAFKSPPAAEPDTDALAVLSLILTSGMSSRLYRRLTDQGLTAGLFGGVSRLRDPGLFYLFAMLAPGHTHEDVEAAILEEIEALQEEGITEAELDRARKKLEAEEAFSRDGSFGVAAQLNEAIAAGDWTLYTTYRERLDRIARADVQRAAQTYLVEDQRTVGWYVPTQDGA